MELFLPAKKVRLRHRHGRYLVAKDNESSVFLDRCGPLERAKWTVEFVGSNSICLKSCYNKYLTICDEHVALRTRGRRVRQTSLPSSDSLVQWQPIKDGEHVKLKSQRGFLRGYTGWYRPWQFSVGHYASNETQRSDWQWNVEIAEHREGHEDTITHEQLPSQAAHVPTRGQTTTQGNRTRRQETQRSLQLGVNAETAATGAAGLGISAAELEQEAGEEEDSVIVDDGDAEDEN